MSGLSLMDRERGRLWSGHRTHRRRVEAARAIIREALSRFWPLYVAFSCGKDSAVLFDLVREEVPEIEGRFIRWPETRWIDDFDRVLAEWEARGARVSVLDLSRASLAERVHDRWHRLRATAPARGAFLGLRADESAARRTTLSVHGPLYVAKDGFARVCPLARWDVNDVAARIWLKDLPVLSRYERDGVEARTVARVPREDHGIRERFLSEIQAHDPQAFSEIRALYPDLR